MNFNKRIKLHKRKSKEKFTSDTLKNNNKKII